MSQYEPHTWVAGETVTASKLNNMEQGIANSGGGGGVAVYAEYDSENDVTNITSHTWQEIYDAVEAGNFVFLILHEEEEEEEPSPKGDTKSGTNLAVDSYFLAPLATITYSAWNAFNYTVEFGNNLMFYVDDPDDYPTTDPNGLGGSSESEPSGGIK